MEFPFFPVCDYLAFGGFILLSLQLLGTREVEEDAKNQFFDEKRKKFC